MTPISTWKECDTAKSLIFKLATYPPISAHSQEGWSNALIVAQDEWLPDALLVSQSSRGWEQRCSSNCSAPYTAHSAEQIPVLPWKKFKNKRQQDFPVLLPSESGELALLHQRFIGLTLLELQEILGTRKSRFSFRVRGFPLQSRKSSFQYPWQDENISPLLPSHSSLLVSSLIPRDHQEQ